MDIEKKIKDCEIYLSKIKQYNPDPFYVNFFLKLYLNSVNEVYNGIIKEASIDFGLFINGKCNKENFELRAKGKNDTLALEFLTWFEKFYNDQHRSSYPNFIKQILDFFVKKGVLPKITIKILATPRYQNDIVQEIHVELKNGKLRSKEGLQMEIKRVIPTFLELINQKRKNNDEPKVTKKNIESSSFLELQNYEDVEISYACEIYLSVLRRVVKESKKEIEKLLIV